MIPWFRNDTITYVHTWCSFHSHTCPCRGCALLSFCSSSWLTRFAIILGGSISMSDTLVLLFFCSCLDWFACHKTWMPLISMIDIFPILEPAFLWVDTYFLPRLIFLDSLYLWCTPQDIFFISLSLLKYIVKIWG